MLDTKNQLLLDYVPKKLLKRFKSMAIMEKNTAYQQAGLETLRTYKKGKPYGKLNLKINKLDQEWSQKFYHLMIDCIKYWGEEPGISTNR